MKTIKLLAGLAVCTLVTLRAEATTFYVDAANLAPATPYTNWLTAATNIQTAIDVATNGDLVLVNDGVYQFGGRTIRQWTNPYLTNRIAVTKPMTIQSINGSAATFIVGDWTAGMTNGPSSVRCAYLTNGATLNGFTLTNGSTRSSAYGGNDTVLDLSGGALLCASTNAYVMNCVMIGNSASKYGGGAYSGTLSNCTLIGNSAFSYAGGAMSNVLINCLISSNSISGAPGGAYGCILSGCSVMNNRAGSSSGLGGGGIAFCFADNCNISSNFIFNASGGGAYFSILTNCVIYGNTGLNGGGASSCSIFNSRLFANSALSQGGGMVGNGQSGKLYNCVVYSNTAAMGGGTYTCSATNCTLVGNTGTNNSGGAFSGTFNNCIVYDNSSPDHPNGGGGTLNNSCTIPMPTSGIGNITNAPLFVQTALADFRLQSNSPCINAGNNAHVTFTKDMDGNSRIRGGAVDIGAYEFQTPASLLSYAWAQQYGLSTDGTADTIDSDGDGMNNWQEWIAGTNPTNNASRLQMLTASDSVSGANVTWQSVSGKTYFLQRGTNLAVPPAFSTIQSNLTGQVGATSFTDTTATNGDSYFYRVGVQY